MPFEPDIELTLAENWIESLRPWAIPGEVLLLDEDDSLAFGSAWSHLRAEYGLDRVLPFSERVETWLADTIAGFGGKAFLRTGRGMVKECPFAYAPVCSVNDAMGLLRWPDSRIGTYAQARLAGASDKISLMLRPWITIEPWQEHRVFVEEGRIVGACPAFPDLPDPSRRFDAEHCFSAITALIAEIAPYAPLESYVADTLMLPSGVARLIELNPFISTTDGILFSWAGGDMDGSFRTTRRAPDTELLEGHT